MAGNAIRHGQYTEPTLVDSVDFWEEQEADENPPKTLLRALDVDSEDDFFEWYWDRRSRIEGLFG